ncbi:MAG: hypothetical protein JWQ49_2255 [Edaphobacter sp.]|nr:hypothetical protein [Edaphobacter sp.]
MNRVKGVALAFSFCSESVRPSLSSIKESAVAPRKIRYDPKAMKTKAEAMELSEDASEDGIYVG